MREVITACNKAGFVYESEQTKDDKREGLRKVRNAGFLRALFLVPKTLGKAPSIFPGIFPPHIIILVSA